MLSRLFNHTNSLLGKLIAIIPILPALYFGNETLAVQKTMDVFSDKIISDSRNFNDDSFLEHLKMLIGKSSQFIVVVTPTWKSPNGTMSYFNHEKDSWKIVESDIPIFVGTKGLGWGLGLIEFEKNGGPIKHEGDGRAPAGLFKISYAFGYLPKDSVRWIKLDYLHITESIECVDDSSAAEYNKLVDTNLVNKNWQSYEKMKLSDNQYKYGIFIEHNSNPAIPGQGSCIFIHVWKKNGGATAGCTVLAEDKLVQLLKWLNPQKNPLILQLPESEFNRLNKFLFK